MMKILKALMDPPPGRRRRAEALAARLRELQASRAALDERERALLPRLQLAALERDRTAADIRMGEAWELAIADSRQRYASMRREADRLARARVATGRAIVALEGRLSAAERAAASGRRLAPRAEHREATPGLEAYDADHRPLLATAAAKVPTPAGPGRPAG